MFQSIIQSLIIGGVLATPPLGVVKLEITSGNSVSHCTATLASDLKVYSAAHCAVVKGDAEIVFDGKRYKTTWNNISVKNDYAIGVAAGLPLIATNKLLEPDFSAPRTGDIISIGGFGCFTKKQDMDFRYREGSASVRSLFVGGFDLDGPVLVCPGDSGGPAFRDGKLVGIISAVAPWVYSVIVQP